MLQARVGCENNHINIVLLSYYRVSRVRVTFKGAVTAGTFTSLPYFDDGDIIKVHMIDDVHCHKFLPLDSRCLRLLHDGQPVPASPTQVLADPGSKSLSHSYTLLDTRKLDICIHTHDSVINLRTPRPLYEIGKASAIGPMIAHLAATGGNSLLVNKSHLIHERIVMYFGATLRHSAFGTEDT